MANFFIDRPVFAWVIAIIIMLAGVVSVFNLPVQQYPNITPPTVSVNAIYPGASASTLESSVIQVIEQKLTGIDGLRYFSSNSSASGAATITITFEPGVDADIAQVQVQNKVQAALPQLPQEVQKQGVSVTKSNSSFLMVVAFFAKDKRISQIEIGDFVASKVQDIIARVDGVGSVMVFGEPHAMRVWLNPHKMLKYSVTTAEILARIRAQNMDVSAGELGAAPAIAGQRLNATITAQSMLKNIEEFKNIIIQVQKDGSQIRLSDVARVELGAERYGNVPRYKRKEATGIAVSLANGANALETAALVKEKINEIKKTLPEGIGIAYPVDTTKFIKLSIKSVAVTLLEAIGLVFLVMYLFLQNIRATLIPVITVPVVLLGVLAILEISGFSINTLTMFAMVLAIGLLVDDAIVVVENVERVMNQEGFSPIEATRKSMKQITGALIGISVVLSAVFVPMAFFSGSVGVIYRQFSITIVSAMGLSVFVALVLTPTLCATLLKPVKGDKIRRSNRGFFGWFNRYFNLGRDYYVTGASYMVKKSFRFIMIYVVLLGGVGYLFTQLPTSFLPDEDQGTLFMMLNTAPGSTIEKTMETIREVEDYFLGNEGDNIEHLFAIAGYSFSGQSQSTGLAFINLRDWKERIGERNSSFAIADRANKALSGLMNAQAFVFYPPPIQEMGNASGFDLQLIDRDDRGHAALMQARNQLLGMAMQNPKLIGVRPNGLEDTPELRINIDHEKANALGVSITDINQTLQSAWGSSYVNDFLDQGRVKKVYMQADAPYRMSLEDIDLWYVKNNSGDMVPFSSFSTTEWTFSSPKLERFNGVGSVNILGQPAQGVSSGEAMDEMQQMVSKIDGGFNIAWSGLSYEEQKAGSQVGLLYGFSILIVFLCLAALYESWSVPFSVILAIPVGLVGAVVGAFAFQLNNDVYFQVALLTTIGLSAKNAILIVEFAKDIYKEGNVTIFEATMQAAKQRYRPIIMTSLAFILGVTPLALSSGAGSASQNAIGIVVIGGMLAATFFAILFVPLFYVTIQNKLGKNIIIENKA